MNLNKFKEYNNNPKKCLWCEKIIPYEKRNNNYCNLSHSSKKHNENIKNKTFEEIYGKEKSDIIKNKLSQKLTGRSLTEEHKARIKQAEVGRQITWGDKISNSLIGRKLSNKHINSLKENHVGMTGLNHTEKTKNKMSKIKIGKNNPMYGRKLSNETKIKMRKSAIRHIEKFRGKVKTNVGKNEKKILDEVENDIKHKIQRQYHIKELGYIVDGYCKSNNTVYEVYERHHRRNVNKDLQRQEEIINFLNCKFNIIWDSCYEKH